STATFAAGAGNNSTGDGDITITAVQDTLIEGTETFTNQGLSLTGAATVSGSGQTIAINDDDSATVSIDSGTMATEGGATGSITATLHVTTNGSPGGAATLQNAVTATIPGNGDYTAST